MRTLVAIPLVSVVMLVGSARAASLEVSVRPGFGSAGDQSPVAYEANPNVISPTGDPIWNRTAKPYGMGLDVQGGLGIRFHYVSVGIDGGLRSSSVEDAGGNITDLKRNGWSVGPYVRGYVPLVPFLDPWVSVGVRYMRDEQTYKQPITVSQGTFPTDWTLEHHGVAVPISVGVDYTILKMLSIGPTFQYALVFPAGACARINAANIASNNFCSDEQERLRVTAGKGYGVWSLGLSLRFTFPPA